MAPVRSSATLTERALLHLAGDTVFQRGEEYVQYVHGLVVADGTARASVQAKRVYAVELDWTGREIGSSCTCPHFAEGYFCKHCVAVGLAALDRTGLAPPRDEAVDMVGGYLDELDAPALRALVGELVQREPAAARLVAVRAAARGTGAAQVAKELTRTVTQVLSVRGFIDYRRSFDVARDAEDLLDELERHLDAGSADAVRPALERATTRLRALTLAADDSSGSLGVTGQRAADLHARACREGRPDAVKLARWLLKFRAESPGWPETLLPSYVDAFDDRALQVYRDGVAALDDAVTPKDGARWEIDRMLLELADHDGDVDRAVELLSAREYPQLDSIVQRLDAVGRREESLAWIDRGVADGRVSGRLGQQGRGFWLDPREVAERYLEAGRAEEALEVLRQEAVSHPGPSTFRLLLDFADGQGRLEVERERALARLRETAHRLDDGGAVLVRIALSEGDVGAAWQEAHAHGAGSAWRELAAASRRTHPAAAADLHQAEVERMLPNSGTRHYAKIAKELAAVRELREAAGQEAAFAGYLVDVRQRYGRRPSLMAALARAGMAPRPAPPPPTPLAFP